MPYPINTLLVTRDRSLGTIMDLQSPQPIKDSFRAFFDAVFAELGLLLLIYDGQRTYEEQWEKRLKHLQGGPRAAAPGGSWHPYGRAIDIIPVFYDGKPNWALPNTVWKRIEKIGERYGLKSGMSFNDPGHYKNTQGASLVKLRQSNPGWEPYAKIEKKMKKGNLVQQARDLFAPSEENKWIKPVVFTVLGSGLIYGIFTYYKQAD